MITPEQREAIHQYFPVSTGREEEIVQWFDVIRHEKITVEDVKSITESAAIPLAVKPAEPEQEVITLIKTWTAEDAELAPPDRMSVEKMVETLQVYPCAENISVTRLAELARTLAPGAPSEKDASVRATKSEEQNETAPYPAELAPLVASGQAFYDTDSKHWKVRRCCQCGKLNEAACCGRKTTPLTAAFGMELTAAGRQAVGLDPITPPAKPKTAEEVATSWSESKWWLYFRGVDELEGDGTIKMLVNGFLPEGVTVLTGLPKEGKSSVAMAVVKALTSGQPLFARPGFEVLETVSVLYLAAEGGDNTLKLRCKKFGITNDKTKFICRTLSQGPMFGLDDPQIEALIRSMHPVVVLETMVRFGDGEDENDAKESNKLAGALFRIISFGARAVVAIHHSRKDIKQKGPSLELAVRGSGDYAAMADVIWTVVRDEKLYRDGAGPNEIDLFGWGRDFNPYPMRLALTEKAPEGTPITSLWKPGLISCIDQTGDLKWVDKEAIKATAVAADQDVADRLERMVQEEPTITLKDLAAKTGSNTWAINGLLKGRGWSKPAGRAKKGHPHRWVKTGSNSNQAVA